MTVKAVSRADVGTPAAQPTASAGTEESMMPWDGWFSSFLKDKMGSDRYESLRNLVLYKPSDIHDMEQSPRPNTRVPISEEDPTLTRQFRYPSPGPQPPVSMGTTDPTFGNAGDDPYNVTYYKRDTGRRNSSDPAAANRNIERIKLQLLPQDDPRVKEAMEEFEKGPGSSPGNKGTFATGKTAYDPSGLRATMSTNYEAAEASLDANMPDHLPTPTWMDDQENIVAWYKERDLPVPIGGVGFGTIPTSARIARW